MEQAILGSAARFGGSADDCRSALPEPFPGTCPPLSTPVPRRSLACSALDLSALIFGMLAARYSSQADHVKTLGSLLSGPGAFQATGSTDMQLPINPRGSYPPHGDPFPPMTADALAGPCSPWHLAAQVASPCCKAFRPRAEPGPSHGFALDPPCFLLLFPLAVFCQEALQAGRGLAPSDEGSMGKCSVSLVSRETGWTISRRVMEVGSASPGP